MPRKIIIRPFRVEDAPLRHETFDWRFPQVRSHHPGAGCVSTRPSSAEKGSKKSNLQDRWRLYFAIIDEKSQFARRHQRMALRISL